MSPIDKSQRLKRKRVKKAIISCAYIISQSPCPRNFNNPQKNWSRKLLGKQNTLTGYNRKKFMNDIFTAEADSRMCWMSTDQKFHAENESGGL